MHTLKNRLIIWAAFPAVRSIFSVVSHQINYVSDGFNRAGLLKNTWHAATEKDAAAIRAAGPDRSISSANPKRSVRAASIKTNPNASFNPFI